MKKIISIILITLSMTFVFASCSSESSGQGEEVTASDKKEVKEEAKVLNVGEKFNFKDKYEITINKVYTTDERNEFADKNPKKVVIIDYTYTNLNLDEALYISELNFKMFDSNGNALDTYPASINSASQVPKGKTAKGSMAFGLDEGDTIEAYYYDNMFNSKEDAIFNLTISK